MESWNEKVDSMLKIAGLPKRASYRPGEVCSILGIADRTFWRYTETFERDPETGGPRHPATLDSYLLRRERRVSYDEIVSFIARNNTWERRNAEDPRQMMMFDNEGNIALN